MAAAPGTAVALDSGPYQPVLCLLVELTSLLGSVCALAVVWEPGVGFLVRNGQHNSGLGRSALPVVPTSMRKTMKPHEVNVLLKKLEKKKCK